MPKAVVVENLSKRFLLGETFAGTLRERLARTLTRSAAHPTREEFWALRDVAFDVEQGEAVGIIGGNGAGKSTLLKILSRITPPTKGRALVRGRLSSLLEVGTGFHPELTGRENVYLNGAILGMRKQEIARKFDEIVDFAGVSKFIDTPVKRYSSGMYVRLAFAVAAHLEPDVLVIDEVLAVGDAEFQKRCLGKMGEVAQQGRTVMFVSHNMAAVQAITSRCVWLQKGIVMHVGSTVDVVGRYLDRTSSDGEYDLVSAIREHSGLTGQVKFLKAAMLDVEDRNSGVRLTFDVAMRSPHRIERLRLGITIVRSDGVQVGALFSEYFEFPAEGYELEVRVTTPELCLGNGRYSVSLSAGVCDSAAGSTAFDAVTGILGFEVTRPAFSGGTVIGWNQGWGACDFGLARACRTR